MKTAFLALAFAAFSLPASAAVLTVNADWTSDTLDVAGAPTQNSPWTVTFTEIGTIWLVDCCIASDVWTISGDVAGVSSFYVGGVLPPQLTVLGEWLSADHSKLVIGNLAPGTYNFSITGDGAGGLSAGVNLAATQVPEPATWAMLITGFGLVGFASRRRRAALAA